MEEWLTWLTRLYDGGLVQIDSCVLVDLPVATEGDFPHLLSFCEALSGVLLPGMGPPAQERHGTFGEEPENGH